MKGCCSFQAKYEEGRRIRTENQEMTGGTSRWEILGYTVRTWRKEQITDDSHNLSMVAINLDR